jgi:hypothetical protein
MKCDPTSLTSSLGLNTMHNTCRQATQAFRRTLLHAFEARFRATRYKNQFLMQSVMACVQECYEL